VFECTNRACPVWVRIQANSPAISAPKCPCCGAGLALRLRVKEVIHFEPVAE
jgi:hypothetical protein